MAAVGGLELILFAILGFGPAILIGVFFLFLASVAPAPTAPRGLHLAPPPIHAEPPAQAPRLPIA